MEDAIDYKVLLRKYMDALFRLEGDVLSPDAVWGTSPAEKAVLEAMSKEVCDE